MQKGDYASKCAAIYSVKESSLLGQVIEFLIFFNPIDESESELASRIRCFHNLATEYYQRAGEPSELAVNLADYSIVEHIHRFSELKHNDNSFDTDAEILLNNCNTTLANIQQSLMQQ